MHCYICDRETNNFRRDPDGKYVSICSVCRKEIRDCNKLYKDIDEEELDLKIASMSPIELIEYIDKDQKNDTKYINADT